MDTTVQQQTSAILKTIVLLNLHMLITWQKRGVKNVMHDADQVGAGT